jgi:hypothetical protein
MTRYETGPPIVVKHLDTAEQKEAYLKTLSDDELAEMADTYIGCIRHYPELQRQLVAVSNWYAESVSDKMTVPSTIHTLILIGQEQAARKESK